MERQIITKTLRVEGMTCPSCELKIENKLKRLPGVAEVQAKYANEIVQLTYDSEQIDILEIIESIESLDYVVKSTQHRERSTSDSDASDKKSNVTSFMAIGIIIFVVYLLTKALQVMFGINVFNFFNYIPEVNQNMGYGILFVVGLLTSLHCIAMCGGINLSQCVSYNTNNNGNNLAKLKPSFLYNAGRVISYTVIGGIVGTIGSVISLSGAAKGLVSILAGIFMIIMGLNMLNIFPRLRKLAPRMPRFFGNKIHNNNGKNGPFIVGLLNGLMPCGPLQTMQIYALGTGSFVSGALSMFMFSLGTVPLMFGFGAVSSILSSKFTHKMMKVSAALVMVLGVVMLNRGFSLSGIDSSSAFGSKRSSDSYENAASVSDGVQYIATSMSGGRYTPITVQKGILVKWTIQAEQKDLNGCNNPFQIPQYGIQVKLKPGDNLVEFTPDESGTIPYSCWMGMIRSRITVVDDLSAASQAVEDSSYADDYDIRSADGGIVDSIPELPSDNRIDTDDILIASTTGGIQEVTVTVTKDDFSPDIIVLKEGVDFVIKFEVVDTLDDADPNGSVIYFPEYQGGIDLIETIETPQLPTVGDFSFQDVIGAKRIFVKIVADTDNIDRESIIQDAQSYTAYPNGDAGGGASCH